MSEFKGTPGPWYRGGVENNKVSINAGNYFVALVDESSAQLANARLIAAAPELLEALERLVIAAENIGGEHITGLMDLDNATEFARMKIKKALGQ